MTDRLQACIKKNSRAVNGSRSRVIEPPAALFDGRPFQSASRRSPRYRVPRSMATLHLPSGKRQLEEGAPGRSGTHVQAGWPRSGADDESTLSNGREIHIPEGVEAIPQGGKGRLSRVDAEEERGAGSHARLRLLLAEARDRTDRKLASLAAGRWARARNDCRARRRERQPGHPDYAKVRQCGSRNASRAAFARPVPTGSPPSAVSTSVTR